MALSRRHVLKLLPAIPTALGLPSLVAAQEQATSGAGDWAAFRDLFELTDGKVHMSAMLLSSHPRPVREAVARYRQALDEDTVTYLEAHMEELTEASRDAAGRYLNVHPSNVALTDSTTMGVGLAYNGLSIRADQEMVATEEDYFVTHESLRLKALETGASVRRIALYENAADAREEAVVSTVLEAIRPETRLLALTWVHSSTGLKMPIRAVADGLADINAERAPEDQVLLGVDGVHGFGVENVSFAELGCDMLMAGCHKWLFGPRGTGVAVFSERALAASRATVPSFTDDPTFTAWLQGQDSPESENNGRRMTPGGFKSFEHRWAMREAFDMHLETGKGAIHDRTHRLATQLKEGLAAIDGVTVRTPVSPALSAGIVAFDIEGWSASEAVAALRERAIVASVAPYAEPHIRLTPSIRNSDEEVDRAIAAVGELV